VNVEARAAWRADRWDRLPSSLYILQLRTLIIPMSNCIAVVCQSLEVEMCQTVAPMAESRQED
jgi:hypothetical protein